jgi:hypothetical protein
MTKCFGNFFEGKKGKSSMKHAPLGDRDKLVKSQLEWRTLVIVNFSNYNLTRPEKGEITLT